MCVLVYVFGIGTRCQYWPLSWTIEESSIEVSSAQHLHETAVDVGSEHIRSGRYWITESDYLDTIKTVILAAIIFLLVKTG